MKNFSFQDSFDYEYFINLLINKLKAANRNSLYLNANSKSKRIIKLEELNNNNGFINSFTDKLLSKENFQIEFTIEDKDLNNVVKNIFEKKEQFKRDTSLQSFHFAYPILILSNKNNDGEFIKAPLFLWQLDIQRVFSKENTWTIIKKNDDNIVFNDALRTYILNNYSIDTNSIYSDISNINILKETEILKVINSLFELLRINKSFDSIPALSPIPSDENIIKSINEQEDDSVFSDIIWSGFFASFKSSVLPIINDLEDIKVAYEFNCYSTRDSLEYKPIGISCLESFPDPSQLKILTSLSNGDTDIFLIQGPPGTGKTESLTQIILDIMTNGKTALVVCEKAVAIEIIYSYLAEIGLNNFTAKIINIQKDIKQILTDINNFSNEYIDLKERFSDGFHINQFLNDTKKYYNLVHKYNDKHNFIYKESNENKIVLNDLIDFLEHTERIKSLGINLDNLLINNDILTSTICNFIENNINPDFIEFYNEYIKGKDSNQLLSPLVLNKRNNDNNFNINYSNDLKDLKSKILLLFDSIERGNDDTTNNNTLKITDKDKKSIEINDEEFDINHLGKYNKEQLNSFKNRINEKLNLLDIDVFFIKSYFDNELPYMVRVAGFQNWYGRNDNDYKIEKSFNIFDLEIIKNRIIEVLNNLTQHSNTLRESISDNSNMTNNEIFFYKEEVRRSYYKLSSYFEQYFYFYHPFKHIYDLIFTLRSEYGSLMHFSISHYKEYLYFFDNFIQQFNILHNNFLKYYECVKKDEENKDEIQQLKNTIQKIDNRISEIENAENEATRIYQLQKENIIKNIYKEIISFNNDKCLINYAFNENISVADIPNVLKNSIPVIEKLEKLNNIDKVVEWESFYFSLNNDEKEIFNELQKYKIENWKEIIGYAKTANSIRNKYQEFTESNISLKELKNQYASLSRNQKEIIGIRNLKKRIKLYDEKPAIAKLYKDSYKDLKNLTRKRNSLKEIINKDINFFLDFFPVIFTSPEVCASIFPMEEGIFDFVIFDEASQLKIEEVFSCLLRGKKAVISGDELQMPPTNDFETKVDFETIFNLNEPDEEKDNSINLAKTNSLLDLATKFENARKFFLEYHYRSKHPYLIDFSNAAFYGNRLVPMPPVVEYKPINFYNVNGKYLENRTNLEEVEKVIDIIFNIIPDEFNFKDKNTKYSLAIATTNMEQKNLIDEKIYEHIQNKPEDDLIYKQYSEKAIINVENLQGDEFDIVVISTNFGENEEGDFLHFFGPFTNKDDGYKRLNVLVTRAKFKNYICTSIPQTEIQNFQEYLKNGNKSIGFFFAYLAYCQSIENNENTQREEILKQIAAYSVHKSYRSSFGYSFDIIKDYVFSKIKELEYDYTISRNIHYGGFKIDFLLENKISNKKIAIDCIPDPVSKSDLAYAYAINKEKELSKNGIEKYCIIDLFNFILNKNYKLEF